MLLITEGSILLGYCVDWQTESIEHMMSASVNLTHVVMETVLRFLILSHSKKKDQEISSVVISYSEVSNYEKHLSGKIQTLYFQPVMHEPPELRTYAFYTRCSESSQIH
jgi:alcohol dehydrogenase YqhD (iron-dependent ADH family)